MPLFSFANYEVVVKFQFSSKEQQQMIEERVCNFYDWVSFCKNVFDWHLGHRVPQKLCVIGLNKHTSEVTLNYA